jgi:hypothetical protein
MFTVATMGLHNGYIVATASQTELLEELSRHAGHIAFDRVVERCEDADLDSGEFELMLGELDGRAFLVDTSMLLSDSPDMVVEMSSRLGTVIGCGAETVSGSYWLTAARDGELLRYVFVSHASLTRGMAIGDPLPSEDEHPIEDLSGRGVFAAMDALGLSPSRWLATGPATVISYDCDRVPEAGPIAAISREHHERYQRPDDDRPKEIVVVAHDGSTGPA